MKNFKTLLLIAVFTLGVGGVANAQKTGHIDFEKLVAEMPQTKQLKLNIEKLSKTYQDEIEGMAQKLDSKMKKYTAEQNAQTREINESRAQEVQQDESEGFAEGTEEAEHRYHRSRYEGGACGSACAGDR